LLQDELDLSFLSALIVGGDALGNQDRKEALARGWPLFETYGMCETASMVAVKKSSEAFTTILPHAEINFGEDGEIKVKASSLFAGYIADNKLDICLDNNNYFATGDISAPDKFNYLEISRKYNRIISGGENIQAEEIERVLEKNTNIESCVVIGIPDEKLGSRPVAFIKYNKIIADHEIYEFLARYLAPYKWPVRFINWPLDAPDGFKKPRRWFYERIIN
jgi:O-succinylbenzoic acid--CoA ligase